jgi:hypothetical protein
VKNRERKDMNRETWLLGLAAALLFSGCAKNKPPEITAVMAFPDQVSVGDSVDLHGRAFDPEHGRLTYKWICKDGQMSVKDDSSASWTTPNKPGTYQVTFSATDPKGLKAEKTLDIKVLAASKMYSGSLNAPDAGGRKKRGRTPIPVPAPQPRKSVNGTHAPKTTK